MSANILKIALLGLGKMGQNHLRILANLPDVKIACIYDNNIELTQKLACDYKLNFIKEPKSLKDFKLDAIIIATPTFTHYNYIKLASKYVKNIFVEKPLCASFGECKKLKKELKKDLENSGLKIQTGFIERYNGAFMELKNIIAAKKARTMDFSRSSFGSSRIKDADVISDLMIHDIDLALYLNGKAKCVFACGFGAEQIDLARAVLKHENGVISTLFASRITHKNERKITADFADIFVECDLLNKKLFICDENGKIEKNPENSNQLELELKDFCEFSKVNFLKNSNIADFKAGAKAIKIADKIRKIIKKA